MLSLELNYHLHVKTDVLPDSEKQKFHLDDFKRLPLNHHQPVNPEPFPSPQEYLEQGSPVTLSNLVKR